MTKFQREFKFYSTELQSLSRAYVKQREGGRLKGVYDVKKLEIENCFDGERNKKKFFYSCCVIASLGESNKAEL